MEDDKSLEIIPDKIRINVWITRTQYNAFATLSSMDNRTLSDLVREAFRDYVQRHQDRLNNVKE